MAFRTYDRKSSESLDLGRKLDIGTTAGHVGGDSDGAGLACTCDYLSLALVLLGVEQLGIMDTCALHHSEQEFGSLDIGSTDEDRTALLAEFEDSCDDSLGLGALGLVYEVILVVADYRTVGRDDDYIEFVD